jgi:hypothetical protein
MIAIRRAARQPIGGPLPYVESVPPPHDERRQRPAHDGLLDVKAFQQVDGAGGQEDRDRCVPGATPPPPKVEAEHHERGPRRQRERVREQRDSRGNRLPDQPRTGADVRRKGGCHVDETNQHREPAEQRGQPVGPACLAKRSWPPVDSRAPCARVAARGQEVLPILDDQPGARRDSRTEDPSGKADLECERREAGEE